MLSFQTPSVEIKEGMPENKHIDNGSIFHGIFSKNSPLGVAI